MTSLGSHEPPQDRAGVILTPDQRVRVFISSTLEELAVERAAARRAIQRLRLAPVWYESGARPHPPRSMYQAYVEQSQVFVGIYWQRYGWVAPGMDISGLEDEFRLASGKKPMLLYLKRPAPDQEPRLKSFIDSIRAAGTTSYRTFATAKDLERLLVEDLAVLLSESFRDATESTGASAPSPAGPGGPGEAELPTGTVTFLFTDIEGSTRLWEQHPEAMQGPLARHDAILEGAIGTCGGTVFSRMGHGMAAAFGSPRGAVAAAVAAQLGLAAEPWPEVVGRLTARMGVHTGEGVLIEGQYLNQPLNRCARLMAVGHGGQVLVSGATEPLVRGGLPEGVALVDLGEHRLRDLSEPLRVFQVRHPGLPSQFPPLRSLEHYQGNLPLQVSSLVGRGEELARVAQALEACRLVTLTGVGGVGKTRLALQVAAETLPRFPDGAWLCELAPVRDPDRVVEAVAGVFQVSARSGMSLEESLLAFFSDQTLLLVLDNCEHLLRPVASLVARVERACPGVRVLATSREGLNVGGEQMLVVPSLGVPDDGASLELIRACEAVQLFIDRARAVKAGFALDLGNAEEVARVCTRLDGVPLAIELAAARIGAMNPAELARRLDRRFRLLTGGDRLAVDRHQTLRATIDWSYELLSGPEKLLLARLSVFSGGCTLEAVEAVCGGGPVEVDEVFELLANLVARSLVVADDTGPSTRYRLLETIRQYSEERLAEASGTDLLRARHADYYIGFAGKTTPELFGPGQLVWGARLASEHDNLHAAMNFALDTGDVERALGLLCQIPLHLFQINKLVIFDPGPVLALPGAAQQPGSARAFYEAGYRAYQANDFPRALELADQAEATERRLGLCPGYLDVAHLCVHVRAQVAEATGSNGRAQELRLGEAERQRAAGRYAVAAIYLAFGSWNFSYSEPAGVARATEGLALARRSGMPLAIHLSLIVLALALAPIDPEQAHRLLIEGATLEYENRPNLTLCCFVAGYLGDWPVLLRSAGRLFHFERRTGTARYYIAIILNFVAAGLAVAQPEAAAVLQGAVLELNRAPETPEPSRAAGPVPPPSGPPPSTQPGPNTLAGRIAEVERDTTRLIAQALGEARLAELRARGKAMDRDEACAYARTHIAEYLAASDEATEG